MIKPDEVQRLIESAITDAQVQVTDLTGTHDHYSVVVVSPAFQGLLPIKRHRMVNAAVAEELNSGAIHAMQLKTFTPDEWAAAQ